MTTIKHIGHTPRIDLTEWCGAAATRIVSEAMERGGASLPIMWNFPPNAGDGMGGDAVDDPLTIYVDFPLGKDADDGDRPTYSFTLVDLIDEMIEDSGEREICESVARRLRELADKIDRIAVTLERIRSAADR